MSTVGTLPKLDPTAILELDGYLKPNIPAIAERWALYAKWKATIDSTEGGYDAFSKGFEKFGINIAGDGTITYREWAPNAIEASLIGDFSKCASSFPPSRVAHAPIAS